MPFLFGNKNIKNQNNNNINENINNIIFFSFNNNYNYHLNLIAKEIYCGEEYLIIVLEKEKLLIYSFNDGLFEIKLNTNNNNDIYFYISKISIVDKNFYILDERNKFLFEFIYFNKNYSKPFNIYDFYQNEYEINPDIKLSIIEMPFFVKFLFFWIECSENEKKDFNLQNTKMFYKLNEKNFRYNCNKGPNINEHILFGNNNKKKIELIKVEYDNLYNKKDKHIFFGGEYIINHKNKNKNNNYRTINVNININNIDSSFQSLNIPISKNYGNRNDAKDNNDNKEQNINMNKINNNTKISDKYNYKYGSNENRIKYCISQDKKRNKININEYECEEKILDHSYGNARIIKHNNKNKNNITLDNNEINNNISYIPNIPNKRENNSFLLKNNANINTNDDTPNIHNIQNIQNNTNNINNNRNKNNFNHISIKNNKNRSTSQIKEGKSHNYYNISSHNINVNNNNNKKDENEFDNILKNINNRKLMLNQQPIKIEDNVISTKKVLSKIGKTKSKTEMLIKELQEAFFGKENNNNNNTNNYYNKYKKINNNNINKEELNEDEIILDEKNIFLKKEEQAVLEKIKKEKEEKIRIEKEMKEKEEKKIKERLIKEKIEKEKKEKEEKERIEKEIKEKKKREKEEREKKEKEEKDKKIKEEKEKKLKEEKEERERIEKEERERIEKEEIEKINKMRLEKEKLEKEIKEIKEKKDKEKLLKDKLEKERIEKEQILKKQIILEEEEKKRKEKLLEKQLREKLENEYKQKYEKEKMIKEEEEKKEKEKLEKIEKEKNEKLIQEKNKTLEKIKELEKQKTVIEELEKEKKLMEEQRKNLLITSEINNFIKGKNDLNKDINGNNYKFMPEKLKTENENDFIMKGNDKKNYNYIISGNQQINIENHLINDNINKNNNNNKNINNNIDINNHKEINFNIEDIVSTRDIIFDNNINSNNNISEKIDSLEEENKNINIMNDLPLKLNNNSNYIDKLTQKQILNSFKNNKYINNIKTENKNILNNKQKNISLKKSTNNINSNNNNNKEENESSLKFSIEDNNKTDIYKIKEKEKEKEDSFDITNISKQEKDKNILSDEDNDNDAPETVLELENSKKKLNLNFNWKEKSKNRISEIIEEKQEFEMIQSLEDNIHNKTNKNDFNLPMPMSYNNEPEQPIIVPVSEVSTNNMRHISTYDQNIISSTRKFEPKELDDITGSLRLFSNRSDNNTTFLSTINKNNNNNKPISQRSNNNLNINSNNNNSINLKPYYGVGDKNKNINWQNFLKNENLFNESYKETNPNEPSLKDQKMKIDDLEQSKNKFLKEEKNGENKIINNINDHIEINGNELNKNIIQEQIKENKIIKPNKIIKLKNKEELTNILIELKKLMDNKGENQSLDESLYFLLENDMEESNIEKNNLKNSQIIKVKNSKITTIDSDSNLLDISFKKELLINNNNNIRNDLNNINDTNNINKNINNINNFNNMNNGNNYNNIIINNDNNFNNINYINDINNNNKIININNNNIDNNHIIREIKKANGNKLLNENSMCERHTYIGRNNMNIFNNNEIPLPFNQYEKNTNMIRAVQIKNMYKNKSYGKDIHKKHKKKTGIIEQIKKEQSEKKNNEMYSTFNNRNKNILIPNNGTPYTNSKAKKYSKNSIAKIDYNNIYQYGYDPSIIPNNIKMNMNMNIKNDENNIHHQKSKSVNINKCLSCSPKKQYEDYSKYNLNQNEFINNNDFIYDNNNINNNIFPINKNNNYNEEEYKKDIMNININLNLKEQEKENNSFILLRQKYLEFLLKIYGNNNNIPVNKENEELDNIFLKGLVKNEVPIENINLNLLKCSNDMKNFICQSLENFKLQQLKEKLSKVNENKSFNLNNIDKNGDNKNNNLNGLIQLDYEDEIKDKSNILEPIELDKSNFNLNFRKSFIESLSGIKNDNIFFKSENIIKK